VGRGDLIRAALVTLAALAAVATAAAATAVHWKVLEAGRTTGAGVQPVGYVAVTKAQEQRFMSRIPAAARPAIQRVDLQTNGVVAVFLDGAPCARDVTVNAVSRTGTTVTVTLHYTRPPVGMATCVQLNTQFVVLKATRASLGTPAPTHVRIVAIART
jgi:hypothetical protein